MDNRKPPQDPDHLLDDLESIHELLGTSDNEPPLLTESFEPDNIPLLSDMVSPRPPLAEPEPELELELELEPETEPEPEPEREPEAPISAAPVADQAHLESELRAAAQLILQDVIDDFAPQIEVELRRRLQVRLEYLLTQRKP